MSESPLDSLTDMVWWMFDTDCVGMGAYRQFDYTLRGDLGSDLSPRLGDCYHLAVSAFTGWERFTYHRTYRASLGLEPEPQARANGLPAPTHLVHGTIHHREEEHRIGHAWVMLDNGDVWEPITGLICDTVLYHQHARAEDVVMYDETTARVNMLRHQHYGPWHQTDERGVPL